jgi:DNA repair exonuclease SbcCD ATPase subunit
MLDINRVKQLFLQSKGMKKQVENNLIQNKITLDNLNDRIKLLEQAQAFLQKVAQDTQECLKLDIESIVNLALETCFPNEYKFQLQFNIARGKTDAELVFLSQKTGRPIDPMNASGGGVVDLTAFALRIASYALEQGADNVIILDEPFRFISRDLQARAGEILKTLSEKLGLQILMVTHINEMIDIADKVFEVKKNSDGRSIVKVRT